MQWYGNESAADRRKAGVLTVLIGAVVAGVYLCTVANYAFPGESAHLMAMWSGLDTLKSPAHPLWGVLVSFVSSHALSSVSLPLQLNLISVVCGVVAAMMVFRLTYIFVLRRINNEDVLSLAPSAARAGGVIAAVAFAFSVAVWQSSTHLEYRIFDLMMVLTLFMMLIPLGRHPKYSWWIIVTMAIFAGIGMVESVLFVAAIPLAGLLAGLVLARNKRFSMGKVYVMAAVVLVSYLLTLRIVMALFALTDAGVANGGSAMDLMLGGIRSSIAELRTWRPGGISIFEVDKDRYQVVMVLCLVVPFVACGFWARRGLAAERTWTDYAFHLVMCVLLYAGLASSVAPPLIRYGGDLPLGTTTAGAVTAGYLTAYWFILWRVQTRREYIIERSGRDMKFSILSANRLGLAVGGVFAATIALTAFDSIFYRGRDRGKFADRCAMEILDRMGDRSWIVTIGTLDDHIRILAKSRGKECNLVCLHRDLDRTYLNALAELVKKSGLKSSRAEKLETVVDLGVKPFLEDWFEGDAEVASRAVVFGIPDFWYQADCVPVYDGLYFAGVKDLKDFDGKKACDDFTNMWKEMSEYLGKGSIAKISDTTDPVDILRLSLRRHIGFMGNNLGVTLQDKGLNDEAFKVYDLVRKEIDQENISTLCNLFEMAKIGVKAARARGAEFERDLKAVVADETKRYPLWSLSRSYGYIRSPDIFVRMGILWARSGQTGAAIQQVRRAYEFVPSDRKAAIINMLGAIYAMSGDSKRSKEQFLKVVGDDPGNHDALMGLARLSLQEGSLDEAREFMTRAAKSSKRKNTSDIEWAMIYLMNNDLDQARISLQSATDTSPDNLQAWGLLAHVMVQQSEKTKDKTASEKILREVESVILPKMEAIAGTGGNYYVNVTRALVLLKQGREARKAARTALAAAYDLRPDVTAVSDMIIRLDIELNDTKMAEIHARNTLRQNRRNPLANYALGYIALQKRDYGNAEMYLANSVNTERPIAIAQNDYAEVLRRIGKLEAAELQARAALKTEPELYVAWETLASILLDRNKDLKDAEEYLKKAIDLCAKNTGQEDIRMQITLARIQHRLGDNVRARMTVRSLKKQRKNLSPFDAEAFDKIEKEVNGK